MLASIVIGKVLITVTDLVHLSRNFVQLLPKSKIWKQSYSEKTRIIGDEARHRRSTILRQIKMMLITLRTRLSKNTAASRRYFCVTSSGRHLAVVNSVATILSSNSWYLDSGASIHISGDSSVFSSMTSSNRMKITSAGGQGYNITGIGSVAICLPNREI
jgi:hypothetical protein